LSALRNLSKNKDLVIVRPDKGNGFVILNKADYIDKVELLLSDTEKFKLLDYDVLDLCIKCEGQLIRFLRDTLLKQRAISESVYNNLFPQGSKPSILYGLPNVHKVNCPARSIMSAIGTFNYKLAKFLVPILQPLTCNQYTVHSSFSFVDEITQLTLSHDAVLVSFDVASLFTNIPLDETVNIILDNLFSGTDEVQVENCVFSKPQFKKLLEFAVKSNHFIFKNHLYEHTDGVAMGSPLGPSFANIFMYALEQNFLSNCPYNYKPIFYRRFVDDAFCIFQNRTQVECFLNYLNRQHPNIEFTQELEENNSLPFLDILVTHVENRFTTNLYRKKTFIGLYTHFNSLSPVQYKINLISVLISVLIYRAFHICSSYKALHSQICKIKRFLQQNRFPAQLIDRIIKRFLNKQYVVDRKPSNVPKLPILLFSSLSRCL